jgi:hypothetical protein
MGSSSPAASVAEVAEWLGISGRRVKELRAEGVLPGDAGDPYDLKACVTAYCAHMRPAAGKSARGGSDAAEDLDVNRARESRLRGDKLELLNAQLRADLIPADEMERAVGAIFDAVRARVLALPSRAAPLLVGARAALAIQETLTELVHDACGDLAATEAVGAIKDSSRKRAGRRASGDADTEEAGAAA